MVESGKGLNDFFKGIEGIVKDKDALAANLKLSKKAAQAEAVTMQTMMEAALEQVDESMMLLDRDFKLRGYSKGCEVYFKDDVRLGMGCEELIADAEEYKSHLTGKLPERGYESGIRLKIGEKEVDLVARTTALYKNNRLYGYCVVLDKKSLLRSIVGYFRPGKKEDGEEEEPEEKTEGLIPAEENNS